jgi:hypothetical protein
MLRDQADGAAVPQPLGLPQFSASPMPDILAARIARACGMRCAWR